jgi:hypothetical protein
VDSLTDYVRRSRYHETLKDNKLFMVGRDTRVHPCNRRIMVWVRRWWKYWARALGEKVGEDNKSADWVAVWRTLIVLQAIITNGFIVWNILRRW